MKAASVGMALLVGICIAQPVAVWGHSPCRCPMDKSTAQHVANPGPLLTIAR